MSWTKPLEQVKSWMEEKSVSPPKEPGPDPRIAQAKDLIKIYRRSKVAEMLDVSKSTITRWCKE
jgi:hypothetical protein